MDVPRRDRIAQLRVPAPARTRPSRRESIVLPPPIEIRSRRAAANVAPVRVRMRLPIDVAHPSHPPSRIGPTVRVVRLRGTVRRDGIRIGSRVSVPIAVARDRDRGEGWRHRRRRRRRRAVDIARVSGHSPDANRRGNLLVDRVHDDQLRRIDHRGGIVDDLRVPRDVVFGEMSRHVRGRGGAEGFRP